MNLLSAAVAAGMGLAVAGSARAQADADARFMSGMIHHHRQALVMVALSPTHGAGEQVLTLSERIRVSQLDEIEVMAGWLRGRGLEVPDSTAHRHGAAHDMPGMLSEAQLAQLDAARGPMFDRVFLLYMIQHHRGAITMVERLLASPGPRDPVAFRIAADVNADQAAEIDRMARLLALLPLGERNP